MLHQYSTDTDSVHWTVDPSVFTRPAVSGVAGSVSEELCYSSVATYRTLSELQLSFQDGPVSTAAAAALLLAHWSPLCSSFWLSCQRGKSQHEEAQWMMGWDHGWDGTPGGRSARVARMPMIHDRRITFARPSSVGSGLEMGTGSFLIRTGWERLIL
ncbi:hypothetical protein CSOJ01_14679 [Colletotrichum sojae]|uniref:Uncharacterized protein n=1 Tax=Colletotrichum sojae TaxID=2175907 RepID=A0A8H6MJ19_9PEZI|nr:hypothetical protein CSOJ01_14679 [Colletotrichum sojae]